MFNENLLTFHYRYRFFYIKKISDLFYSNLFILIKSTNGFFVVVDISRQIKEFFLNVVCPFRARVKMRVCVSLNNMINYLIIVVVMVMVMMMMMMVFDGHVWYIFLLFYLLTNIYLIIIC